MNRVLLDLASESFRFGVLAGTVGLGAGATAAGILYWKTADGQNTMSLIKGMTLSGFIGGCAGKILPVAWEAFRALHIEYQILAGAALVGLAGYHRNRVKYLPENQRKGVDMMILATLIAAVTLSYFHGRVYALHPLLEWFIKAPL